MTTSTERLRALLDERGVRYKVEDAFYGYTDRGQRIKPTYHTIWRGENGARAEYIQCDEHDYTLLDYMRCSPEQAIAATLGSGMCEMEPTFLEPVEMNGYYQEWRCLGCDGFTLVESIDPDEKPKFCSNCGRKAVSV